MNVYPTKGAETEGVKKDPQTVSIYFSFNFFTLCYKIRIRIRGT